MKKKMSDETKIKLIYSGELVIIALIVLVISILKFTGVMPTKQTRLLVYNIISLIGFVWIVVDFVWSIASAKRRKKTCFLDKFLMLPVAGYILFFDIACFAKVFTYESPFVQYSIAGILMYLAVIELFMAVYHWFKPVPQIQEAIDEANKPEEVIEQVVEVKDAPEEEKKEE